MIFPFFMTLYRQSKKKHRLEISYLNLNGTVSKREIEPHYLRNSDGQWYLLAWCHFREDLRIFHLSRIEKWTLLKKLYVSTVSIDEAANKFDSSFGVMTGTGNVKSVSILFKGKATHLVSGKKWHGEQVVERVPGGIKVSFPVHSYEEILRTVLSYHSDAEVLGPPEFCLLWKEKIKEMANLFL